MFKNILFKSYISQTIKSTLSPFKSIFPSTFLLYPQKLYFTSLGFKLNNNCIAALDKVRLRYNDIVDKLNRSSNIDKKTSDRLTQKEISTLNKELKNIEPLADEVSNYQNKMKELNDLKNIIDDKSSDKDMRDLANEEILSVQSEIDEIEERLLLLLVPAEDMDNRNAILEVRAGAGGLEASLFAQELLNMYMNYSRIQGWKFEILSTSESDVGGLKEGTAQICGVGVFGKLKFESGCHRVQRVPKTDSAGRIHTSAATIAILPEVKDIDIKIVDTDLKIDFFRSSGAGGQSVNKTESAVRITHIPTGIVVQNQDQRSQHQNKAKAMQVLLTRLYMAEKEKSNAARQSSRSLQIGTGSRSDKIRTYHFVQGRITDHRVNVSKFGIEKMMDGELLDEFVDELSKLNVIEILSELYDIKVDKKAILDSDE